MDIIEVYKIILEIEKAEEEVLTTNGAGGGVQMKAMPLVKMVFCFLQ